MSKVTTKARIRSEDIDSYEVISIDSTTGVEAVIARPQQTGYVHDIVVNSTAGDSIGEWTQPAGTVITDIKIFCAIAPVIGTGDIGYEVGSTSSGVQLVAAQTDEILDGGTTVVVGNVTLITLVVQTQDGVTAPASVQWTAAERTVYCNITNSVDSTTDGSFTFIIEYVHVE